MTPKTSLKPGSNKAINERYFIRRLLSLIFFTLITSSVFSQKTMEIGLFGGVSYYLGDLNPGMHLKNPKIGYGAVARFNIDSRWAVKLNVFRGKVKGSSQSTTFLPERNLSFESPVTDISATAEFNFLKYYTGSRRDFISPYIYTGISAFFYDPVANGYSLRSLGTEGQNIGYTDPNNGKERKTYSSMAVCFPISAGIKYNLAHNVNLSFQITHRLTMTDYLDDVSTTFIGIDKFPPLNGQPSTAGIMQDRSFETGTPIGTEGRQRGLSKQKDQ